MVDRIRRLLAWQSRPRTLSDWEQIFYNSKVNGAEYVGDRLSANHIDWDQLRKQQKEKEGVENE